MADLRDRLRPAGSIRDNNEAFTIRAAKQAVEFNKPRDRPEETIHEQANLE
jgi:hypothetical protein